MAFRAQLRHFLILLLLGIGLMACQRFLTGQANKNNVVKIQPTEFICLKTWPDQIKNYFEDNLDATQTGQIFTCIDQALVIFEKFTSGANKDLYTGFELRGFFNRYLLHDNQIDDSFGNELMKVKVFLVGGSSDTVTRAELGKIHDLIKLMGEQAQSLRGQWKILLMAKTSVIPVTLDQIHQAQTDSQKALLQLISAVQPATASYGWTDLQNLIKEITNFLKNKDSIGNLLQWMPLMNSVRNLLVGDNLKMDTTQDWLQITQWLSGIYNLAIEVNAQKFSLTSPQTWPEIIHLVDLGINLLEASPQMKSKQLLTAASIDSVIDELATAHQIPDAVPPEIVKETYRHFLAHFTVKAKAASAEGNSFVGLGKTQWEALKFEYQVWRLSQLAFSQIFSTTNPLDFSNLLQQSKDLQATVVPLSADQSFAKDEKQGLLQSWEDMKKLLAGPQPLIFKDSQRLQIPAFPWSLPWNKDAQRAVDFNSLSMLNAIRSASRIVLSTYGDKKSSNPWNGKMSEQGFRDWEADFRALGEALHLLDSRQPNSGERAYSESIFFAYSSEGLATVSAQQLTELLALMISGGGSVVDDMMKFLATDQCLTNNVDKIFHLPIIDEKCFLVSIKKHFSEIFTNLPELVADVREGGNTSLDDLIPIALQIAQLDGKDPGTIEYAELRSFSGVLHFIEAIMAVFDRNHEQLLSEKEILSARPRFQSAIAKFSPLGNWFTEDAYLFVIYNGKIPDSAGVGGFLSGTSEFTSFTVKSAVGLGKIPRMNLLKVMTLLKQQSNSP